MSHCGRQVEKRPEHWRGPGVRMADACKHGAASGAHEPQANGVVRPAKVAQVGQHARQLGVGHAEPFGEGGCVLVYRRAGQQAALAHVPLVVGIGGVGDAHRWRLAIEARPLTAPPTMKWWLPHPWSDPSPLELRVRPKSDAVNAVTLSATPSSTVAS